MRWAAARLLPRAVRPVAEHSVRPYSGQLCPKCRRAPSRIDKRFGTDTPQRGLSSSHVRAQENQGGSHSSTRADRVVPQTYYDLFPETFPNGPPPRSPYSPDLKRLRKEFLQMQSKAHPDLAPPGQKRHAEAASARINEAYKTLQEPLRRAQYLLSLQDIDVEDESMKLSENALLMEVMEAREAVEEVENEEDLVSLREANQQRIDESVRALEGYFGSGDSERAAQEAIRLRYWKNIEESIQGWEKGAGGGIIHH